MATVTVSFTALPAHVRTARFIAASVARRAGVAEGLLDEIRLAVSEACSLAVRQHQVFASAAPIELTLIEDGGTFSIQVADAVVRVAPLEHAGLLDLTGSDVLALPDSLNGQLAAGDAVTDGADSDDEAVVGGLQARERIGLAVISGLVDDVRVHYGDTGAIVTMTWPVVGLSETANVPSGVG